MPDKLKNWDLVGRCYDVLHIDPFRIEAGAKTDMAFQFDSEDFENILDGSAQKPKYSQYVSLTGGDYESNTLTISSSYDLKTFNKVEGSVSLSDPTGELFSSTLSASYSETRDSTETLKNVLTYSTQIVFAYKLVLSQSELKVSKNLGASVAKLPRQAGDRYTKFITDFGTHYASEVVFGGRAYQRISLKEVEYSDFLEEAINVDANAKATFEIATVTGNVGLKDTRSTKFVDTTKNSTDQMKFSRGTPSDNFSGWTRSVLDRPTAIKVKLNPISDILTNQFFPNDGLIGDKQTIMRGEIDKYLKSNGKDALKSVLHYGDQIFLCLVAKGPARSLSDEAKSYARTSQLGREPGASKSLRWVIVHPDDPQRKDEVRIGDVVAIQSASGGYLDARAGTDQNYAKGQGLAAANGAQPNTPTARWKVTLADARKRNEIADGDYLRLQSQWKNGDGYFGYLKGEADSRDPAQRVYSRGKPSAPGTIWRISRTAAE